MRVGWSADGSPQPPREAVRGVVYRDLRLPNRPAWSDLTSAGPWAIDPGGRCDRHFHDCDEYWLIAGGAALVEVDGERQRIAAGDVLCIERGRLHDIVELYAPLRAFWLEGPVVPGGRAGSLHRDEVDALGHVVPLAHEEAGAPGAEPTGRAEPLVVRELTATWRPAWSDLYSAGTFELSADDHFERHFHPCDEYWLVRGGSALVELDRERVVVAPGDVLCIERGRVHDVVELYAPLRAFWLQRGNDDARPRHASPEDATGHAVPLVTGPAGPGAGDG
ncbi:MAG TPA: cupin domain-containing protein [Conexibacter sp.]|nr:cupin domain-containing protein [Conexibacter sp.]